MTAEDALSIFYNDLPIAEGKKWAAKIVHQSLGVYYSTTTYSPLKDFPSTFLMGAKDQSAISSEIVKEHMIGPAQADNPKAFDQVETCEAGGHCLMISQPDWLAEQLLKAAAARTWSS